MFRDVHEMIMDLIKITDNIFKHQWKARERTGRNIVKTESEKEKNPKMC